MNRIDDFDQILSDALEEYREAEPLAGLETRILQRLDGVDRRTGRVPQWVLGLAAAVAIVAVCVWLAFPSVERRSQPAPQIVQRQPQPELATETAKLQPQDDSSMASDRNTANRASRAPHAARARRELAAVAQPPVRERFPAAVPLSAQERELQMTARTDPAALRGLNVDHDLTITPIDIKPLETGGNEGDD